MNLCFEELVDGYISNQVGISTSFLTAKLAAELKTNLTSLYNNDEMKLAGIGNNHLHTQDKSVRSDKIYWMNPKDKIQSEKEFFDLIDSFVEYLNINCFTGIKSYEFHYAYYEVGSFYKKHIDQFKSDGGRAFSLIMYLNPEWIESNGGQLKIYKPQSVELISPDNQKCVFFKSNELAHEVQLSKAPRMSITGWLKTSF